MRIPTLMIAIFSLVGCSSLPRYVPTGGSENPYIMFDSETAQACYAGSLDGLKGRIQAIRRQADADASLDKPSAIGSYYFGGDKGALPVPSFVELARHSLEYSKKAAEEYREADRLAESQELPTCRSLLTEGKGQKVN
jgi:hypothetical protein